MNTVTTVLKWLMFVAITFFITTLGVAVIVGMQRDKTLRTQVGTALYNTSAVMYNANVTVTELNKPKIGVISQLYETIRGVRLATDNINKAAIDERLFLEKQQPETVAKINTILDNTVKVTETLNTKIGDIGTKSAIAIDSTNTAVVTLNGTIQEATSTLQDLHKIAANPDVPVIIANVKDTTGNAKEATNYVKIEAKDTADWWHSFLHPTWQQRLFTATRNTAISVAKFFF